MELTRRFAPGRRRGWLSSFVCGALLLGVVATAVGDLPKDRPNRREGRGGLTPANHALSRYVMDRNRVILLLTDVGEIGSSGSSVAGGGFWVTTTNQYIFSSGPNVGATVPGTGDTVVAIGGPFSELHFGSVEFPEFPNSSGLGHGVSSPAGVFWDSTVPSDAANFPEVCSVDDSRVASFPTLQPFRGEPFPGFADQTVCMAVNDITGGTCADCAGTRVGVEIIETLFAFGVPSVQDFVFLSFRIYNRTEFLNATTAPAQPAGPYDLENTTVSIAMDPDVGEAGDDQGSFLPDVQTMVYWDSDFNEPSFQGVPGFGGVTYLQTPLDPATGEEVGLANFTLFTNGAPRPDPSSKEEWYQLMTGDPNEALLTVSPQDVRIMASSGLFTLPAGEFVEIYGAYFFANVSGAPPAQLLGQAFRLPNGQNDPNANQSPAFDNFKLVQQTAQATFDAGFVVPTAPPKPRTVLIPGDRQITVVWEAAPVTAVNPFAKVALDPFARLGTGQPDPEAPPTGAVLVAGQVIYVPARDQGGLTGFVTIEEAGIAPGTAVTNPAFNPNFVPQDFQGFKVYRSRTGLPQDAELIAQFDLQDGIVGGTFCLEAFPVFAEDGTLVQVVCTAQGDLGLGTDTGLQFSVVDRGGSFPNPADGPGLVNGIPVSYTVTSYSVNCGESPVRLAGLDPFEVLGPPFPPAACLVLESGLQPFVTATPRSESSALIPGEFSFRALKADGTTCDDHRPAATIDPATGEYTSLIECSNAVHNVIVNANRGENLAGTFRLVIDSLIAVEFPYILASGTNVTRAWYHWEREDGSLATEITPTVGFIAQTFAFTHGGHDAVTWSFDTDPSDVGADAAFTFEMQSHFSVFEDLEVNGNSVHFGELGGTHASERRPHRVNNTSLGSYIVLGAHRGLANAREYANPGPYAMGAMNFELTWSVNGGVYSGTLVNLNSGETVPLIGPKGGQNTSTPADNVLGYNLAFIGPCATPVACGITAFPTPTGTPTINLTPGANYAVYVPGQSVTIAGATGLPQNGDVWTFRIDAGSDRSLLCPGGFDSAGREPCAPTGPFSYIETSDGVSPATVNPYPGMTWEITFAPSTNLVENADLSQVRVVPNPFVAANEITRGRGLQRIQFTNLPPAATIRIYTISGNLVRVLEHSGGSGTLEWDVRTRFDLLVASGNYYYHVTTPDGRTHIGRFAVVN